MGEALGIHTVSAQTLIGDEAYGDTEEKALQWGSGHQVLVLAPAWPSLGLPLFELQFSLLENGRKGSREGLTEYQSPICVTSGRMAVLHSFTQLAFTRSFQFPFSL